MKLINESVWDFKSIKWSAWATILVSVVLLILQNALDLKLLPEPYDNMASMIIVLLTAIAGKKVYQPELHTPDLNSYTSQNLVNFAPQKSELSDLAWIVEAKKFVGLKENTSRTAHNSTILNWLVSLNAWWKEDETPWCGVFVAHCLKVAGVAYPKQWYRALAYLDGGTKLDKPAYGCIAIKTRKGGGHVCFVVGITPQGKLVCLGGNQNNMVSYATYDVNEFEQFRWYGRTKNPAEHRYDLPIITSVSATKVSEA